MSPHSYPNDARRPAQPRDLTVFKYLVEHNLLRMARDDRHGRSYYWALETRRLVEVAAALLADLQAERGGR